MLTYRIGDHKRWPQPLNIGARSLKFERAIWVENSRLTGIFSFLPPWPLLGRVYAFWQV